MTANGGLKINKFWKNLINNRYFHICWFADVNSYIKSKDPLVRQEWIQMVLNRGKTNDIKELSDKEIKKTLPFLHLPKETKILWEKYFEKIK